MNDRFDEVVPLLPEQRRFLHRQMASFNHWNIAALLTVKPPLNADVCEQALAVVVRRHDGLRLAMNPDWADDYGLLSDGARPVAIDSVDLSDVDDAGMAAAVEAHATALQASMDLLTPPLVRAAYFSLGAGRADRVLIVVHHFVADGMSMRLVVRDFVTACEHIVAGDVPRFGRAGMPAPRWAAQLAKLAESGELDHEVDTWRQVARPVAPLPVELEGGENTLASGAEEMASLSAHDTARLPARVGTVVPRLGAGMHDVILAALVDVVEEWTGSSTVRVNLIGHGRRGLVPGVNLARTVGWLTTVHPVTLSLPRTRGRETVAHVREQLRRVPSAGASFGVLRYMSPRDDVVGPLADIGEAELTVNYLGHMDHGLPDNGLLGPAFEPTGPTQTTDGIRVHVHGLDVFIMGGQLHVLWSYSSNMFRSSTIKGLAERLIEFIRSL